MDLDGIDNGQKKDEPGQADPHHGETAAADTTAGSMGSSPMDQPGRATRNLFKRYAHHDNTGGYGFALACMLVAFLVRWLFDVYLNDALPSATFLLACIIVAAYRGLAASLTAVVLGGLLSNWFFVSPRYEFRLTGLLDQAEMAIYLTISLSTIGFIHTWRWAWRKTEIMTKELNRQMTTKSSTKD
jgi:K+-sensing histidine kinase KdpD